MIRKVTILLAGGMLAALGFACSATAAKFNQKLDVGSAAPDWKNLAGTDGKSHSLADYKESRLLVVVFTTNRCPVAVAYEDRLIELQKQFGPKGVQLVAINCNTNAGNALPAMKERAADKGFNFPYLYDESQQAGKDYGATVTPHVFLLDAGRKVAYMGAVDDNIDSGKVRNHDLQAAIEALLAGNTPTTTETRQFGCGIQYH